MSTDSKVERHKWFRDPDRETFNREGIDIIRNTDHDHGPFIQKVESHLREINLATSKSELLQQLSTLANREQALAGTQKSRYDRDGPKVFRGAGQMSKSFLKTFSKFIQACSGIIYLIQGAGPSCGFAGFETLSVLLNTINNKSANDTGLSSSLDCITNSLPRLDALREIYPTPELEANVARAYRSIIVFSREATLYFTSRWRRVVWALTRPASTGVQAKASELNKLLAEVSRDAMVGLHDRVDKVHKQNAKTHDQNIALHQKIAQLDEDLRKANLLLSKTKAQIDDSAAGEDQKQLDDMWAKLSCDGDHQNWAETNLQNALQTLIGDFPESFPSSNDCQSGVVNQYARSMDPDTLFNDESYQRWSQCASSSLYFLGGETLCEGRQRQQFSATSWLSPSTVFVAERHGFHQTRDESRISEQATPAEMEQTNDLCIYFNCEPDFQQNTPTGRNLWPLMAYIIWQAFRWARIGRSRTNDFRRRAGLISAQYSRDKRQALHEAIDLILEMINLSKREDAVVRIVIDRLDRCRAQPDPESDTEIKVYHIMEELSRLCMGSTPCVVKLFVVVDAPYKGTSWGPGANRWDPDNFIFRVWDQEKRMAYG